MPPKISGKSGLVRAEATATAEPVGIAIRGRKLIDHDQVGLLDSLDHELGNPVATPNLEGLARVGVDQQHLQLTPIPRVDQAWGIQAGDAVAQG